MNPDNFDELAGEFAFHLSDTHGYPVELFKKDLESMTYEGFYRILNKHKDFIKRLKIK